MEISIDVETLKDLSAGYVESETRRQAIAKFRAEEGWSAAHIFMQWLGVHGIQMVSSSSDFTQSYRVGRSVGAPLVKITVEIDDA